MVTVALRRVDLDSSGGPDILEFIDRNRYLLLPNTSGAIDAAEAVRLARLARAMGLPDWVKLEVTPDPRYLLPDPVETLKAAEQLVADGFIVLPYCSADPVLCKHLEEAGCATVMPLGSWIGSNQGLRTRDAIKIIVEQASVPVVVDASMAGAGAAAVAIATPAAGNSSIVAQLTSPAQGSTVQAPIFEVDPLWPKTRPRWHARSAMRSTQGGAPSRRDLRRRAMRPKRRRPSPASWIRSDLRGDPCTHTRTGAERVRDARHRSRRLSRSGQTCRFSRSRRLRRPDRATRGCPS